MRDMDTVLAPRVDGRLEDAPKVRQMLDLVKQKYQEAHKARKACAADLQQVSGAVSAALSEHNTLAADNKQLLRKLARRQLQCSRLEEKLQVAAAGRNRAEQDAAAARQATLETQHAADAKEQQLHLEMLQQHFEKHRLEEQVGVLNSEISSLRAQLQAQQQANQDVLAAAKAQHQQQLQQQAAQLQQQAAQLQQQATQLAVLQAAAKKLQEQEEKETAAVKDRQALTQAMEVFSRMNICKEEEAQEVAQAATVKAVEAEPSAAPGSERKVQKGKKVPAHAGLLMCRQALKSAVASRGTPTGRADRDKVPAHHNGSTTGDNRLVNLVTDSPAAAPEVPARISSDTDANGLSAPAPEVPAESSTTTHNNMDRPAAAPESKEYAPRKNRLWQHALSAATTSSVRPRPTPHSAQQEVDSSTTETMNIKNEPHAVASKACAPTNSDAAPCKTSNNSLRPSDNSAPRPSGNAPRKPTRNNHGLLFSRAMAGITGSPASSSSSADAADATVRVTLHPRGGAKAAGSKTGDTNTAASTSSVQQSAVPAAEAPAVKEQEAPSSNVGEPAAAQPTAPEAIMFQQEAFMPELPPNAITAEVVSGGHCPHLYSSDGVLLTHSSGKGASAEQAIIPAVHVPGAGWGDVVMVGLSWQGPQGSSSGRLVSRLLYHHRVDNCRDPLTSSWEEVQRVVAGVCRHH